MAANYRTVITKVGQAKIATVIANSSKIALTEFALGDGGGGAFEPSEDQTTLINEVYRTTISNVAVADKAVNMIEINMSVPANIGGWVVREMGVYDADGDLIAVSNVPDDIKPSPESGAAKDVIYRMFILVANADAVEIKIDANVQLATKEDVEAIKINLQAQIDALQELINQMQHYKDFADINPTYTSATAFATAFAAMANNSILCAQVTANSVDYPASGLLEVIKLDATHAACTLSAVDGDYQLNISTEPTTEGIKNSWLKIALDADITALEVEMANVKKSVSDGKTLVAGAITAKGVTTAADATFQAMSDNIGAIPVGIDTSDATATAARILSGYTAYAKGQKLTGTYTASSCPSLYSMTSDATATASDIISGKTAYVAGSKLSGTMPNNGGASSAISGGSLKAGYTSGGSISNLTAGNIRSGVTIGGVRGTYSGTTTTLPNDQAVYNVMTTKNTNISDGFEWSIFAAKYSNNTGHSHSIGSGIYIVSFPTITDVTGSGISSQVYNSGGTASYAIVYAPYATTITVDYTSYAGNSVSIYKI